MQDVKHPELDPMLLSFVCPPLDLVIELDEEAGTIYDLGHHGPALSKRAPFVVKQFGSGTPRHHKILRGRCLPRKSYGCRAMNGLRMPSQRPKTSATLRVVIGDI
jgi:hypothetical protein